MFSAGQYQSTEKGYELFIVFWNIIFSNLNLIELFLYIF